MMSERLFRILSPLAMTAIVLIAINSNGSGRNKNVVKVNAASSQVVEAVRVAQEANEINAGNLHSARDVSVHDEITKEASALQRKLR